MKVELELYKYGGIVCLSTDCQHRKECANHVTAGDFRSEDGFTPRLTEQNGEYFCKSYDTLSDNDQYRPWPKNHKMYGALNQKKLKIKSTINYQI